MLYRKLKDDISVSILGFGAMRLPLIGGTQSPVDSFNPARLIDEEETQRMVEYAIDHGVNYFDTAYNYHGGKSEVVLGKALRPHRDKVIIATKLPVFSVTGRENFDRFLDEQLERLGTTCLDLYLLHGLNEHTWAKVRDLGVLEFLDHIQKDGRARRVGFSFHDTMSVFKEIVDSYDWAMCLMQYNYLDEQFQAGKDGLHYAASKGLGVVIMEPLRGGKLANVPTEVQSLLNSSPEKRTPAEWAFRWVWNHQEVSTVLSGMNSLDQVRDNIRAAEKGEANSLSTKEIALLNQARAVYRRMFRVDCTGCGYCMPCPAGVNIPSNLALYNDVLVFNDPTGVMVYNAFLSSEQKASSCTECGECEEKCPQNIQIREELKKVHLTLHREQAES
jgi:predicted aldo/keto reductase-like oxidoreductase